MIKRGDMNRKEDVCFVDPPVGSPALRPVFSSCRSPRLGSPQWLLLGPAAPTGGPAQHPPEDRVRPRTEPMIGAPGRRDREPREEREEEEEWM